MSQGKLNAILAGTTVVLDELSTEISGLRHTLLLSKGAPSNHSYLTLEKNVKLTIESLLFALEMLEKAIPATTLKRAITELEAKTGIGKVPATHICLAHDCPECTGEAENENSLAFLATEDKAEEE